MSLLKNILYATLLGTTLTGGASNWREKDELKYKIFVGLNTIDYLQTNRYVVKQPDKYSELNPIIGKHPSRNRLNNHFVTTTLAEELISNLLNQDDRDLFQNWCIVWKSLAILHASSHRERDR